MKILILNILPNWIYKLYEEYIMSIKTFMESNYENIYVNIKFYNYDDIYFIDKDFIFNYNNDTLSSYNKIFFSGNISIANYIVDNKIFSLHNFYYINIEQLSKKSYLDVFMRLNKKINIIDYSEENIPYIHEINNNVYLLPPYYTINKYNLNIINNVDNKSIDIITLSNNDYRRNIFNNIILNNFDKKYNIIFLENCFGDSRNLYYAKSKIYINIHCSVEHKTMELIRIINLIMHKVIIITQKSICDDLLFIKDFLIICNDDSYIKTYTEEILRDYTFYYNKIYKNFNEDKYINYVKMHYDKIMLS
jgi:hypothetical protein